MHDSPREYDDGYRSCSCFWGREPSSLLKMIVGSLKPVPGAKAVDVGCGEGKNSQALAEIGYSVDAIDHSVLAIRNGKRSFRNEGIQWHICDVLDFDYGRQEYDVVIAYGVIHCLKSVQDAERLLLNLKDCTRDGGLHLICSFNSGPHDFRAHPGFNPLLLPHSWFLDQYSEWRLTRATDSILQETHPHNKIPHFHSLTRLIASKPYGVHLPART